MIPQFYENNWGTESVVNTAVMKTVSTTPLFPLTFSPGRYFVTWCEFLSLLTCGLIVLARNMHCKHCGCEHNRWQFQSYGSSPSMTRIRPLTFTTLFTAEKRSFTAKDNIPHSQLLFSGVVYWSSGCISESGILPVEPFQMAHSCFLHAMKSKSFLESKMNK